MLVSLLQDPRTAVGLSHWGRRMWHKVLNPWSSRILPPQMSAVCAHMYACPRCSMRPYHPLLHLYYQTAVVCCCAPSFVFRLPPSLTHTPQREQNLSRCGHARRTASRCILQNSIVPRTWSACWILTWLWMYWRERPSWNWLNPCIKLNYTFHSTRLLLEAPQAKFRFSVTRRQFLVGFWALQINSL